jgi:hypothetical protein
MKVDMFAMREKEKKKEVSHKKEKTGSSLLLRTGIRGGKLSVLVVAAVYVGAKCGPGAGGGSGGAAVAQVELPRPQEAEALMTEAELAQHEEQELRNLPNRNLSLATEVVRRGVRVPTNRQPTADVYLDLGPLRYVLIFFSTLPPQLGLGPKVNARVHMAYAALVYLMVVLITKHARQSAYLANLYSGDIALGPEDDPHNSTVPESESREPLVVAAPQDAKSANSLSGAPDAPTETPEQKSEERETSASALAAPAMPESGSARLRLYATPSLHAPVVLTPVMSFTGAPLQHPAAARSKTQARTIQTLNQFRAVIGLAFVLLNLVVSYCLGRVLGSRGAALRSFLFTLLHVIGYFVFTVWMVRTYADAQSEDEKFVIVVIVHPVLDVVFSQVCFTLMTPVYNHPRIASPFIFFLPKLVFALVGRFFITNLNGIGVQIVSVVLLAIVEIVRRVSRPVRSYALWLVLSCCNRRAAIGRMEVTRTSEQTAHDIYTHMARQLFGVIFSTGFTIFARLLGSEGGVQWDQIGIVFALQIAVEIATDTLCILVEETYLDIKLISFARKRYQESNRFTFVFIFAAIYTANLLNDSFYRCAIASFT